MRPFVTTWVTSLPKANTSVAVLTKVGGMPVGLGGRLQRLDNMAEMSAATGTLSHALRASFEVTWSNSLVSRSHNQTCSSWMRRRQTDPPVIFFEVLGGSYCHTSSPRALMARPDMRQ